MPNFTARALVFAWNVFRDKAEHLNSSFGALKSIVSEHERIHAGRAFMYSHEHFLAPDEIMMHYFLISSESNVHLRSYDFISDQGPSKVYLYEEPFYDVNSLGTIHVQRNLNRTSINSAQSIVYHDPFYDINSLGEELSLNFQPEATGGPLKSIAGESVAPVTEWILKKGFVYGLRFDNLSVNSTTVVCKFFNYSPTN
ncbi:hypothetical protein KAR91_47780 [Candidatus Pacearchaeota archaeon]|nr:hypothetical protein [Candidatus Pacearchaeota archaeon]